ncbi:hypothetical protein GWK47_021441 [Chionoecetes opilio]|uniref:HAT C-terminal dimerisation domain-containing protein n=1 Tax=Chionoecetes opilio TaxID=41210 RepID=A0A8J5CKI6_CHIOP|nr:hypothetical protein GWK47_021441 [Chionoecetes opilio]
MDKYVKRSDSDRSRSVSGDSSCSSVSYRTSTPAPSASRTHTPQGTSDISLSDVELDSSQLFTQDIEESGTEQEDQRKRQEGTRQLKAMLWHLEKCTKLILQCVRTAFDGASKRGCPKAREDELPAKRGGRQLCLEESFSRKDIVTPEVLRKTCTSSAAVEKLFSSAGDILRPKRSSLSNINFEQLVFVRGNMHLLGYKEV